TSASSSGSPSDAGALEGRIYSVPSSRRSPERARATSNLFSLTDRRAYARRRTARLAGRRIGAASTLYSSMSTPVLVHSPKTTVDKASLQRRHSSHGDG